MRVPGAWAAMALPVVALLSAGAAPASFSMATPMPDFRPPQLPPKTPAPSGYIAAPTPNSDASAPHGRASKDTSVAPGFFTRRDQYRGEGLSPSSSAQTEQDRRAKPGAGINLTMPLQ